MTTHLSACIECISILLWQSQRFARGHLLLLYSGFRFVLCHFLLPPVEKKSPFPVASRQKRRLPAKTLRPQMFCPRSADLSDLVLAYRTVPLDKHRVPFMGFLLIKYFLSVPPNFPSQDPADAVPVLRFRLLESRRRKNRTGKFTPKRPIESLKRTFEDVNHATASRSPFHSIIRSFIHPEWGRRNARRSAKSISIHQQERKKNWFQVERNL